MKPEEWKSWVLAYSWLVLYIVISNKSFTIRKNFACTCKLSLKHDITAAEANKVRFLLDLFWKKFRRLFG